MLLSKGTKKMLANTDIDTKELLRAIEQMYEPVEEEWEWTRLLFDLEMTCPTHYVGERNLTLMRYTCPYCKVALKKEPRV